MTDELSPPVRQLVKDGVWQVPPELRLSNWRTMAVRECEETETKVHTRRKRTTEVVIQEQPDVPVQSPEPSEADVQEALVSVSVESSIPAFEEPPIISHLPDDGDYVKEVIEILYQQNELSVEDNDGNWAEWEQGQDRLQELQDSISNWRKSKAKVDRALSHWVHRNRAQLRHLGIGSAAIKDLWRVFQTGIILEMEDADRRVLEERDRRLAK